jgi:hypothetical protein
MGGRKACQRKASRQEFVARNFFSLGVCRKVEKVAVEGLSLRWVVV